MMDLPGDGRNKNLNGMRNRIYLLIIKSGKLPHIKMLSIAYARYSFLAIASSRTNQANIKLVHSDYLIINLKGKKYEK